MAFHHLVGSDPAPQQAVALGVVLLADDRWGPDPHGPRQYPAMTRCGCGCEAPTGAPCWYCEEVA